MLLQVSRRSAAKQDGKEAAWRTLKLEAGKHHSIRLATLASMIEVATEGHFDVVIHSVDKMMAELRQEEMDDITLRDYCQAEEVKTEQEIEDLTHEMETIQGLIDRLNAKKEEVEADIKETEKDISTTEDAMAEALSTRNSENEDFKAALKDDLDAVSLIASAIDALAAFYKNNKLPLNLAQTEKKHEKKHDKKHHGKQDPDKMPETFSGAVRWGCQPGRWHCFHYGLHQGGPRERDQAVQGGRGSGTVGVRRREECGHEEHRGTEREKDYSGAEAAAQSEFDAERSAAMK